MIIDKAVRYIDPHTFCPKIKFQATLDIELAKDNSQVITVEEIFNKILDKLKEFDELPTGVYIGAESILPVLNSNYIINPNQSKVFTVPDESIIMNQCDTPVFSKNDVVYNVETKRFPPSYDIDPDKISNTKYIIALVTKLQKDLMLEGYDTLYYIILYKFVEPLTLDTKYAILARVCNTK